MLKGEEGKKETVLHMKMTYVAVVAVLEHKKCPYFSLLTTSGNLLF